MIIGCWLLAERIIDPGRRLECRYEDLCSNPSDALTQLAKFLGRSSSESEAALAAHQHDSINGRANSGRVAELSHHVRLSEPLNAGRIGRYRAELTARQIQQIEAILQYGLTAYGYALTEWQASPLTKSDTLYMTRVMIRNLVTRCIRKLTGR